MVNTRGIDADIVWHWLRQITDPEIPVISLVDLGIIRDVICDDEDECIVTITPTYSGCPATAVIAESIVKGLHDHGIANVKLETRLSPAWCTDWISEEGRRKLHAYGIAPPGQCTPDRAIDISGLRKQANHAHRIACPRCESISTRRLSQFGSTACKALYRCDDCLEPFDYFKPL
jgi:ring-1,2-phenylacetyl-CoA epoxidase subunit PaaD